MLCYLTVTTGVIVNYHYCMGRLASTQLFTSELEVCPSCGMEMHEEMTCCRDEVAFVKMEVDQQQASHLVLELTAPAVIISHPSDSYFVLLDDIQPGKLYANHSPPLLTEQDTYLQNRVFRI